MAQRTLCSTTTIWRTTSSKIVPLGTGACLGCPPKKNMISNNLTSSKDAIDLAGQCQRAGGEFLQLQSRKWTYFVSNCYLTQYERNYIKLRTLSGEFGRADHSNSKPPELINVLRPNERNLMCSRHDPTQGL